MKPEQPPHNSKMLITIFSPHRVASPTYFVAEDNALAESPRSGHVSKVRVMVLLHISVENPIRVREILFSSGIAGQDQEVLHFFGGGDVRWMG